MRRFSRRYGNWCCQSWNVTGGSKRGSSTTRAFPRKGSIRSGWLGNIAASLASRTTCQVAVTLSIANHDVSLPVAYRLHLPKEWASDRKRRRKVGVPDEISFKTKPEIALAQIRWACEAGLPRGAVLMDAGYGVDTDLRTSMTALGLRYVAGIQSHTTVWAPGTGPRPPKKWSGHGRPPKLLRRDGKYRPASVKKLALALPKRSGRRRVPSARRHCQAAMADRTICDDSSRAGCVPDV
jgi:SRSO17 transposase